MCFLLLLNAFGHLVFMFAIILGLEEAQGNLLGLSDVLDTLEEDIKEEKEKKGWHFSTLKRSPLLECCLFFNICNSLNIVHIVQKIYNFLCSVSKSSQSKFLPGQISHQSIERVHHLKGLVQD